MLFFNNWDISLYLVYYCDTVMPHCYCGRIIKTTLNEYNKHNTDQYLQVVSVGNGFGFALYFKELYGI